MRTCIAGFLLLFLLDVSALRAQGSSVPNSTPAARSDESVDSNGPPSPADATTAPTTTASGAPVSRPPAWASLVRVAATGGPIAFLLLAWLIGFVLHLRLVHKEQAQFPVIRGTRAPQTVPIIVSAMLFLVPALMFVLFEVRSRIEIRRGIGGVVDEWHPVTVHAWMTWLICLVLALVPWLFARRADTVG